MPPARRAPATPVRAVAAGVNFGDDSFYMGGFTLPEGDYALGFDVRLHAFTKQNGTKGEEYLGVMVTAYPLLADGFGDPLEQFYSMGKKSKLSFMPDPDTAKGLVPIPNAPASSMPRLTNWDILRKSLYDSGLPQGIFTNDLTTIDGVWVHTMNQKAPEERKSFGASTGEAAEEQRESLISVVTEILDGGKPWEGGGGLPEGVEATPPKPAARAAAKPAARAAAPATRAAAPAAPAPRAAAPRGRAAAPPPPVEEELGSDEAVLEAANNAVSAVLGTLKPGASMKKILLRTEAFKQLSDDADMAQAVMETHFKGDAELNEILGGYGYTIAGMDIKPA